MMNGWLRVSILVMMDLSFWPVWLDMVMSLLHSFNPCYDGFVFLTHYKFSGGAYLCSFNPCYDGFVFLTKIWNPKTKKGGYVSILVMMDLSFWHALSGVSLIGFQFQSLLWWICLFDRCIVLVFSWPGMFQSLLWWICLFDSN